ncbi:hypothetical protein [Desulfallas thermosapovorans]|uniref:hypothetical protein n=1 Tax=Desulfallas thermosapovorans TaxID=58137 RepID=UPI001411C071|nr:hypothetical protein [Desulfallas thermosapovorans]
MSTTIIILIIAYLIMSRIMGKNRGNLPRRPGRPPRGDIEHTASGDAICRNEGGPLPGPWDARSEDGLLPGPWDARGEDGPLPGPWDTRGEDGPLPGPWNRPPRSGNVPSPDSPWEWERPVELEEPVFNRRQQPAAAETIKDTGPVDDTVTTIPQKPTANRMWRRAGNPLATAIHSKRTILGSMILGEVLNSRGGRNRRHRGLFR